MKGFVLELRIISIMWLHQGVISYSSMVGIGIAVEGWSFSYQVIFLFGIADETVKMVGAHDYEVSLFYERSCLVVTGADLSKR